MRIIDLGLTPYRDAWSAQEDAHRQVIAGGEPRLLLVEHPPVITFGRRGDVGNHLLAAADQLQKLGVEVVHSDRGGDITFHGPGQLVAYPIARLADFRLSVSGYVHRLEQIVIAALQSFHITGFADPDAVGVWTRNGQTVAKICAIGVRIKQGTSLHGLALNVNGDLSGFELINPCGLGRPVTSIARILQDRAPDMPAAKSALVEQFEAAFVSYNS